MTLIINFLSYILLAEEFWIFIMLILGVYLLYAFSFKKEWNKLRLEEKVCYSTNLKFTSRKIWFFRNLAKVILLLLILVSFVITIFYNPDMFQKDLNMLSKVKNMIPFFAFLVSIVFAQNLNVPDQNSNNAELFMVYFKKIRMNYISKLVDSEIEYLSRKNHNRIEQMFNVKSLRKTINETSEISEISKRKKEAKSRLLYILLSFSAPDEFSCKHSKEVEAYSSDSAKLDFLEKVISLRESLKGEKPFNDSEFKHFYRVVLPMIGVSHYVIHRKIKMASTIDKNELAIEIGEIDDYFEKEFVQSKKTAVELKNDDFEKVLEEAFG